MRRIVKQRPDLFHASDLAQGRGEGVGFGAAHRWIVKPEIDAVRCQRRGRDLGESRRRALAHEGAAADLAVDQPLCRGLGIGAADGANGQTKLIGQFTMRWDPDASRQKPVGDVVGQRRHNRQIARPSVLCEVWYPICHHNNVSIVTVGRAYYHHRIAAIFKLYRNMRSKYRYNGGSKALIAAMVSSSDGFTPPWFQAGAHPW